MEIHLSCNTSVVLFHGRFGSMASLADLGRSSYVSQRGLADTLKKLQDAGKLAEDEPTSRASIKRARELELSKMTTRFGPIMLQKTLTGDSKETYSVSVLNPVSMWAYLVESCDGLKPVLDEAFSKHKPQFNLPWDLIVYCDELVLGNALRHQNNRKLQVFYFSWKQLGPSALAREQCWFPLAVIRSSIVVSLGGVTNVWPQLLDPKLYLVLYLFLVHPNIFVYIYIVHVHIYIYIYILYMSIYIYISCIDICINMIMERIYTMSEIARATLIYSSDSCPCICFRIRS